MTPDDRAFIGRVWLENGIAEHASVASFARFVLHLMGLGAPPDLLLDTIAAMGDEVRHAQACFGVAARFTGTYAGPGPLDLSGVMSSPDDPSSVLEGAIAEGCVGETISLKYLEKGLRRAEDPGIRRVLAGLVEDETRHAELAWRFLEWMLGVAPELAGVAKASFERAVAEPTPEANIYEPAIAEGYGYVNLKVRNEVRREVLHDIIAPRAASFLHSVATVSSG